MLRIIRKFSVDTIFKQNNTQFRISTSLIFFPHFSNVFICISLVLAGSTVNFMRSKPDIPTCLINTASFEQMLPALSGMIPVD